MLYWDFFFSVTAFLFFIIKIYLHIYNATDVYYYTVDIKNEVLYLYNMPIKSLIECIKIKNKFI